MGKTIMAMKTVAGFLIYPLLHSNRVPLMSALNDFFISFRFTLVDPAGLEPAARAL